MATINQDLDVEPEFVCGDCGKGFEEVAAARRHDIIVHGKEYNLL